MSAGSALGLRKIFSFEFVVDYFDRSHEFYTQRMGLAETHRSSPAWEREFNSRGIYFGGGKFKILLTTPKSSHAYTADFLRILSPGIRRVTFQVESLRQAVEYLSAHDATFVHKEIVLSSQNSEHRFITITTPIGFLEFTFLEISGDPADIPMFDKSECSPAIPPAAVYQDIDHMTINARTIYPIASFFSHVMDLSKFWSVSFHTPDYSTGQEGTGLSSVVMWDRNSGIKFATNEPLYPHFNRSQIQAFINENHGAGIQHVAFAVPDIVSTVKTLRERGVRFLDTPDTYYALLPERLLRQNVKSLKEDIADLKNERILVDGHNGKYLLQIFLQDASTLYHEEKAGPFFYEIVQRQGHNGFGEGNFRALFEAIEAQAGKS